jgi:UDP-glucose 4-epimerase
MNLLEMMPGSGIPALVFSSSCTVYGQPDRLPVTEDSPVKEAASPYGYTKQVGEVIIRDTMAARPLLKAISLRYFNPIGAHPSALIGELPRGVPENLVPFITQTALGLRDELKVFGTDYDTPDGSCIRDYLHVVDLAKAHVVALRRLLDGKNRKNYEVFNLGTGTGVSVLEAIGSFERVSGVKLRYSITGRRAGDIEKIWADPSLANRELGWKTESTLDQAMDTAWRWEKKIRNR